MSPSEFALSSEDRASGLYSPRIVCVDFLGNSNNDKHHQDNSDSNDRFGKRVYDSPDSTTAPPTPDYCCGRDEEEEEEEEVVKRCDSCRFCLDVCDDPLCVGCKVKRRINQSLEENGCVYEAGMGIGRRLSAWLFRGASPFAKVPRFTRCQVRRHRSKHDCWIVAYGTVYDATPFLYKHPGSHEVILRKAGLDCSIDFDFHSSHARNRIWRGLRIGEVAPCQADACGTTSAATSCCVM